jgi:hypothetical protein
MGHFTPGLVCWLFQIEGNSLGDFLAKRAAMLFAGLSMLSFLARQSQSAEVQRLVSASIGTAMGGMALLGVSEWIWGMAGPGILLAVAVELVIAGLCYKVLLALRGAR